MAKRNAAPQVDPFDTVLACVKVARELLEGGRPEAAEQYAFVARTQVARIVALCREATLPARKAKDAERKATIAAEPVTCDRCDKPFPRGALMMYHGCLYCADCDKALRKLDAERNAPEGY